VLWCRVDDVVGAGSGWLVAVGLYSAVVELFRYWRGVELSLVVDVGSGPLRVAGVWCGSVVGLLVGL
jgi:hypothetical protein